MICKMIGREYIVYSILALLFLCHILAYCSFMVYIRTIIVFSRENITVEKMTMILRKPFRSPTRSHNPPLHLQFGSSRWNSFGAFLWHACISICMWVGCELICISFFSHNQSTSSCFFATGAFTLGFYQTLLSLGFLALNIESFCVEGL
jgi:hypothetical protein